MSHRPFSAAAERNREPILNSLRHLLADSGRALEIGSGTAQHVLHFAPALPGWVWQPSEAPDQFETLVASLSDPARPQTIRAPITLDVAAEWPVSAETFDVIYSANTAHIMSWLEVEAMFAGVAKRLSVEGQFILYGPFKLGGRHHAESNAQFDASLRQRDPVMGIRDLDALDTLAATVGLVRVAEFAMPANNHLLVFRPNRDTRDTRER